jgi:MtN3 and saliva related transmembrane protein
LLFEALAGRSFVQMTEAIGWFSSLVLILTISKQIHKQWREGSSEGVSKWLFIGQVTASAGFAVYSWILGNWVFVVTNLLMLLSAFIGLGIVFLHRRRERKNGGGTETKKEDDDGYRTSYEISS